MDKFSASRSIGVVAILTALGTGCTGGFVPLRGDAPSDCQEYFDRWAEVSPDTLSIAIQNGNFVCPTNEVDMKAAMDSFDITERGAYNARDYVPGLPYRTESKSYADRDGSSVEIKGEDFYYSGECDVDDSSVNCKSSGTQ